MALETREAMAALMEKWRQLGHDQVGRWPEPILNAIGRISPSADL
jgi:hypothetical protein